MSMANSGNNDAWQHNKKTQEEADKEAQAARKKAAEAKEEKRAVKEKVRAVLQKPAYAGKQVEQGDYAFMKDITEAMGIRGAQGEDKAARNFLKEEFQLVVMNGFFVVPSKP